MSQVPGFPGNPHAVDAGVYDEGSPPAMQAAILTLAYEQRTANLISVLRSGYSDVKVNGLNYNALADQIVARLLPKGK